MRSVTGGSKNPLLSNLEKNGVVAEELDEDFRDELEKYHLLSFYETKGMKLGGREMGLVSSNHFQIKLGSNWTTWAYL